MRVSEWKSSQKNEDFLDRIERAIAKSRAVLENERRPQYPLDVPHTYEDKFSLAIALGNTAVAAIVNALEILGLTPSILDTLVQWGSAQRKAVLLKFKALETSVFDRMEKREVSDFTHVRDDGHTRMSDQTVTTITEHFWKMGVEWELAASAGEEKIVLCERQVESVLVTRTEVPPHPGVTMRDAMELNISWLVTRLVKGESMKTHFTIDREAKQCRTPRRNPQVDEAIECCRVVQDWAHRIHTYFAVVVFPLHQLYRLAISCIDDDTVFVPILPVVFSRSAAATRLSASTGMVSLGSDDIEEGVMQGKDLTRFLEEQRRSLFEKIADLVKTFPTAESGVLISQAEVRTAFGVKHLRTLCAFFEGGVDCIEDMLLQQLVSAIGKDVTPMDFAEYMVYHNRHVMRKEYVPRSFCYSVRRSDHDPEGVLSLEDQHGPIHTMTREISTDGTVLFSLEAGVDVRFCGKAYLHGFLTHSFAGDKGPQLKLCARARQFSCFLLLVGRMAGAGVFEPQYGMIVKNGDELTIPLDLDMIPSAGQFKKATVSISPEQQAFAKMYRGMQLASTVFAVCVLQIKPQLEKLLRLKEDSLTKEIQLTQDLLQLFIEFQIPGDVVAFGGSLDTSEEARLAIVKRNVRLLHLTVELEKLQPEFDACNANEDRELERATARRSPPAALQQTKTPDLKQSILISKELYAEGLLSKEEYDERRLDAIRKATRTTYDQPVAANVMLEYAKQNDVKNLETMLKLGLPVDYRDEDTGNTPLMVACQAGKRQAMFYLVEQGADVNAQNMYGSTPLHELVKNKQENLATWLIKHGADIYLEDKRTSSPFDLALPWFQKEMKKVAAGVDMSKRYEVREVTQTTYSMPKKHSEKYGDQPVLLKVKAGAGTTSVEEMWKALSAGEKEVVRSTEQNNPTFLSDKEQEAGGFFSGSPVYADVTERHAAIQHQLPRGIKLGKMPVNARGENSGGLRLGRDRNHLFGRDNAHLGEADQLQSFLDDQEEKLEKVQSYSERQEFTHAQTGKPIKVFFQNNGCRTVFVNSDWTGRTLVEKVCEQLGFENYSKHFQLLEHVKGREKKIAPDANVLQTKAKWPLITGPSGNETSKWCRFVVIPRSDAPAAMVEDYIHSTNLAAEPSFQQVSGKVAQQQPRGLVLMEDDTTRIKEKYHALREALGKCKDALLKERDELESHMADFVPRDIPTSSMSSQAQSALDFSAYPTQLDARLVAQDPDGAVRPTVINVGKCWTKRSQRGFLGPMASQSLGVHEQKLEKNACWDLLDTLTQSGGILIEDAQLHVMIATTHCFEKSLMSTLIQDNVNPIEKLEKSSCIVASVLHCVEEKLILRE